MKTSLESLSEKKQHQLRALVGLIRAEAEVEMVILFGSFARGDAVEDPVGGYFSDFDVLVIVKSPAMVDKFNVWSTIENRARALGGRSLLGLGELVPARVVVHNLEDLGKRAGDLHPALRNVFPRGTPEENRLFKLLKHAYVDARYDPKFTITRQELEAIAVHVRELRTRVEKVCRERIEAMDSPPS